MNIQKSVQDAWEILLLKEPTINSVAKDKNALRPALLIFGATTLVAAFGRMLFPSTVGMVSYRSSVSDVFVEAAISIVAGIAMLYLTAYLAEKVFNSKLDMNAYVQIMGHAALVNVLGILPALSTVSGIWSLIVMCVVLNKIGHLQAGSIVLLILLQVILMSFLIGWVLFAGLGIGMGSMMY